MTDISTEQDITPLTKTAGPTRRRKKPFVEKHLRIHADYAARLEALDAFLVTQPDLAPSGKLKLADRLRVAVMVGVEALEARRKAWEES